MIGIALFFLLHIAGMHVMKPVYVLVAPSSRSELTVQRRLLHGVARGKIVFLRAASSSALNQGLQRVSHEPAGIIAIPYAQCAARIPMADRNETGKMAAFLNKRGFEIYAAAGNHGATCDGMHRGRTYPAMLVHVCSVGALKNDGSVWQRSAHFLATVPVRDYARRMPLVYADGIYSDENLNIVGTSVAVTRAALERAYGIISICKQ